MRFSYHAEQWLPYSIEDVFAFFANPDNLPRLMPPWQKARIDFATIVPPASLDPTQTVATAAGAGSLITLSFRPIPCSPIRLRWDAEIVEFAWNDHFCDRQLRGPFAYWNHCHRLTAVEREGMQVTLVSDQVEYEMPLGALGTLAHRLFMHRQIEAMFGFRQQQVAAILSHPEKQHF